MTRNCNKCRWFIPMRMLTKAEAKRVHNGEYIETRRCIWQKCQHEPKEQKND